MSNHPFVIVDRDRASQFTLIGRVRRLFHDYRLYTDPVRNVWARKQVGADFFAVPSLGPGWVFNDYARDQRAQDLVALEQTCAQREEHDHRQFLDQVIAGIGFGRRTELVLWALHQHFLEAKRSVFRMPDQFMAGYLWGPDRTAWPKHWRSVLTQILHGLGWLHVAHDPAGGPPMLGEHSSLLIHSACLRGSESDCCDDDCPLRAGMRHSHYLINLGRGFGGILEELATGEENGTRSYNFGIRARRGGGVSLRQIGKTGQLVTVYLPAKLSQPSNSQRVSEKQLDLLQVFVCETSRNTKKSRRDLCEALIIPGNQIRSISGRRSIECPLLRADQDYVTFGGNRKRKAMGYRIARWLSKAGYLATDVGSFLNDIANLQLELGLIVVGLERGSDQCLDLTSLQALAATARGRRQLSDIHIRIYTSADYLVRWNTYFGWQDTATITGELLVHALTPLLTAMRRKGITGRRLASGLEKDTSFVAKILNGSKPCPAGFFESATAWVEACEPQRPRARPLLPIIARLEHQHGSMRDVAFAYFELSWSIVPQIRGAKKPTVKWKPFQERRPTKRLLRQWFARWPDAGIAVVLGPVSGLFVIDVDGKESHDVLVEHLGAEPIAPKVLSGSREPYRYHLFFADPGIPTKAKGTPWHPNLEFRGRGGIVVAPPSAHVSGNRYEWAPGQSPDEIPLSLPPCAVMEALRPLRHANTLPSLLPESPSLQLDVSPTTQEFMSGRYSQGPQWNDRLFRAACDLAGRGIPIATAEPLLLMGAQPWNEGEAGAVRRTIHSAYSQPRMPSYH